MTGDRPLRYGLLFGLFFIGHGTYFSALSPYTHSHFGSRAYLVILAGQICFPFGYFAAGVLSDRTRRLRALLVPSLLAHAPLQFFLFQFPHDFAVTLALSAATRFLFAVNFQLITISVLEGGGLLRFGRYRVSGTAAFFGVHLLLFLSESPGLFGAQALGDSFGAGPSVAAENPRLFAFVGLVAIWLTAIVATGIQPQRESRQVYHFRDAARILLRRDTALFFLLSFLFFFGYQLVDFHLGGWLKERGGMQAVYAAWCLAVVLELPFLPLAGWMARRHGLRSLFYVSLVAGLLRFGYLAGSVIGLPLPSPVFSQLLHGLHFTGYYMGAIFRLRATFPEHLFGTANGFYIVFCSALGGMCGNVFYGRLLYQNGNADFFPLFFSAMILQVVLIFGFLFLPTPIERSVTDETS